VYCVEATRSVIPVNFHDRFVTTEYENTFFSKGMASSRLGEIKFKRRMPWLKRMIPK